MELVNLCPHPVVVFGNNTEPVYDLPEPPEWSEARTEYVDTWVANCIKRKVVVGVNNLPPPKKGVVYVVSNVVRSSFPARPDLASPGGVEIRKGVRGCRYLIMN